MARAMLWPGKTLDLLLGNGDVTFGTCSLLLTGSGFPRMAHSLPAICSGHSFPIVGPGPLARLKHRPGIQRGHPSLGPVGTMEGSLA